MKRTTIAAISPLLLFAASKLIFNAEGDPGGAVNLNAALYINAAVSAIIIIGVVLCRKKPLTLKVDGVHLFPLALYSAAALSAAYSLNKPISLYWAMTGFGYYFVALFIGETICASAVTVRDRYLMFRKFLLIFAIGSIIINALFVVIYLDTSIFSGVPSDFVAMLLLFVYIADYFMRRSAKGTFKIVMVLLVGLFLNSFSSYLAMFAGLLILSIETKSYLRFGLLAVFVITGVIVGISYLENNIGSTLLFDKPAEAYLTGSGRFALYTTAYEIYFNELSLIQQVFGVGFMAERALLEGRDLFWITDPHNSLILNALGLGVVGVAIYLSFVLYPVYAKNQLDREYKKYWVFFHVGSAVFGMTSSYYLGRPSFLLLFSLVLYQVLTSRPRPRESAEFFGQASKGAAIPG